MKNNEPRRVLCEGRFARLVAQNGWEWVERTNTSGAVVIVAVTPDRQLVLVEQYRIPLARRVVELPAGLAGDAADSRHEELAEAAHRNCSKRPASRRPICTFWPKVPARPA